MENIIKLKEGDPNVFKQVYYNYSPKLYTYLYQKTKSEYCANEVVQLAFIKLWKNKERLNEHVKLSTQLFQIVKTTLIDELRREGRYKEKVKHLCIEENLFKSAVQADDNESVRMLHRAIEKLPPVRRKVFKLNKLEQLSYKEIAEAMSISVKTVDKHIQLALQCIKRDYKSQSLVMLLCLLLIGCLGWGMIL